MIDLVCFMFPMIHVHGYGFALFSTAPLEDYDISIIDMFRGVHGYPVDALVFSVILTGPLFTLLSSCLVKAPLRVVWKVIFIIYFPLSIVISAVELFLMVFNIFGPDKTPTIAGWIPLVVNIFCGIFLFVAALTKRFSKEIFRQSI